MGQNLQQQWMRWRLVAVIGAVPEPSQAGQKIYWNPQCLEVLMEHSPAQVGVHIPV